MAMERYAYLGPLGTFSDEIGRKYFERVGITAGLAHTTNREVIEAVHLAQCRYGVVAIENSYEGSVAESIDALIAFPSLFIAAEVVAPIRHCLAAHQGAVLEEIRSVGSHIQALRQCGRWLDSNCGRDGVKFSEFPSTAEAARYLYDRVEAHRAVVCSAATAERYGLQVLAENIQDSPSNATRFLILNSENTKSKRPPSLRPTKTTILFRLKDKPGALVSALEPLAKAKINIVRIESRPTKEALGQYWFFLDLECDTAPQTVRNAIDELVQRTATYRFLGSYPVINYK